MSWTGRAKHYTLCFLSFYKTFFHENHRVGLGVVARHRVCDHAEVFLEQERVVPTAAGCGSRCRHGSWVETQICGADHARHRWYRTRIAEKLFEVVFVSPEVSNYRNYFYLSLRRVKMVKCVFSSVRVGTGDSRQSLSVHLGLRTERRRMIDIVGIQMRILMFLVRRRHRRGWSYGSRRRVHHCQVAWADDCHGPSHRWKGRWGEHVVLRVLLGLGAVPVVLTLSLLGLLANESHKVR